MKPKKIIILVVLSVVIGLVLLAIFLYTTNTGGFFKKNTAGENTDPITFPVSTNTEETETSPEEIPNEIPVKETGGESDTTLFIDTLATISHAPVTGARIVETKEGSIVRYAETGTGHIFDTDPFLFVPEKIINMTLPRVQNTLFSADGKQVLYQYSTADNTYIRSYFGTIITSASSSNIVGQILPGTILDALFYGQSLITLEEGINLGAVYKTDLSKKTKVTLFESPFTEWKLVVGDQNNVGLLTKPLFGNRDFLFFLNLNTKEITRQSSGVGFSAQISPDGKRILRGETQTDTVTMSISTVGSTTYRVLPVQTLPEKCVWANDSVVLYCLVPKSLPEETALPDAWYKGLVSFSDTIYEINTLTNETRLLIPYNSEKEFDGEYLEIDSNDSYLIFRDKISGFLWRFILPIDEEGDEGE